MTERLFITGTGTEIGKTYFTAALIRALIKAGIRARAVKPVTSGYAEGAESDPERLLAAMNEAVTPEAIMHIAPWRFAAPLSPHLAGPAPGLHRIIDFCNDAAQEADALLIEGAGGVMSPLNDVHTSLDLISALGCGAMLLAGCYLGAISHGLTAVSALLTRGIPLRAVIVNAETGELAEETAGALRRFAPATFPVYIMPRHAREEEMPWLKSLMQSASR